jgi:predicted anti-sigma-YlaC factor YlaD
MAMTMVADSISQTGTTFAKDDDPELIRSAIPFGLKLYESMLDKQPRHRGLLLAAASGFTQYAAAFVQDEADRVEDEDIERARQLRRRARQLFLRGRDYALRGLEVEHAGFRQRLARDPAATLAKVRKRSDVAFLFWAGASWAGALTAAKDDLDLVAELPTAAALVRRSLELDDTFLDGAAHEFFVGYEGARAGAMGGNLARARQHYERALTISKGRRASVHVRLAESVAVREQNEPAFRALIAKALAIDPDVHVELRLANTLARRRATWLQTRISDLFLTSDTSEEEAAP